jgi:transposase
VEVIAVPARKLFVQQVPDEVERELEKLRRQGVGRVSQRAHMVLLSLRGFSVAEIAHVFDCGEDVVRTWLHRFEHRGNRPIHEVLEDAPRSGRPPKDPLAGQIIDAQASQSPPCFGLLQTCWTVALLAAHLTALFGLVLSPSSVRRYLHRFRWRWGRPKLSLDNLRRQWPRRDPERPAKLVALEQARAEAEQKPAEVHFLYTDESDLCLLAVVRACWQKVARQLRIPTPGSDNPKRTLFGALDVVTGRWFYLVAPNRKSEHFEALLDLIEQGLPTGQIVIGLDGGPAHTAKRIGKWLEAHPRVNFCWLPKYSGHETNPVELIWRHLKDKVAANRYYGRIEYLVEAARRYFSERTPEQMLCLAGLQPGPNLLQPT